MNSERLNALAVLSIEKNFLSCHPENKEKIDFSRKLKQEELVSFLNE
jgi:hypothetical protein